jgi:ubiquinone/menaquinone biosynthesis C-methylase UbiE
MSNISKAWDWNKNADNIWFIPCEESYYLINRWKQRGFKKFIDLGCGRGRHSIQFAKEGFEVSSVDLSRDAINGLKEWSEKEKLNIEVDICDMMKFPFEDNSFDCLLAYHVISHTDSNGIKSIISEIERILKDGAEFYVTLCSKNAWSYKEAGYPKLDDNTVIKIEDGAENNIPHFYVDEISIKELFSDLNLVTVRQVQDVILEGHDYVSWHYFILGKK